VPDPTADTPTELLVMGILTDAEPFPVNPEVADNEATVTLKCPTGTLPPCPPGSGCP